MAEEGENLSFRTIRGWPLRFMVRVSSTHASLRAEIAGSARSKKIQM
jgi:hypothetical protein